MIALGDQLRADDDVDLACPPSTARIRRRGRGTRWCREVTTAVRASGNSAATSSAMRSTPGPQATRLSSSPHSGHSRGGGMTWPQWWQARRCISRCSTIHAVQLGHWKRCPQVRHKVSGAKPRRLRNSRLCSPAARLALEFGDERRRQPAAARRRVLRQVERGDGRHDRAAPWRSLEQQLAIAPDLDHVARLDRRGRRRQDDRDLLEMAAHHRDVAGVILDAFLLLEARLMRFVDDDQPEVGVRQEQRRARADHDLGIAAGDRAPRPPALRGAQVGMPRDRLARRSAR